MSNDTAADGQTQAASLRTPSGRVLVTAVALQLVKLLEHPVPIVLRDSLAVIFYRDAVMILVSAQVKQYPGRFVRGELAGVVQQVDQHLLQAIRIADDRRLLQLGLKPNWNIADNPLPWIDWVLNGADLTNFFENKVAEYEVGGLAGEWNYRTRPLSFTVFSKEGCPYCVKAKNALVAAGHSFTTVDLTDDDLRRQFYEDMGFVGGERSVPKIYLERSDGPELVGGWADLERLLDAI